MAKRKTGIGMFGIKQGRRLRRLPFPVDPHKQAVTAIAFFLGAVPRSRVGGGRCP